MRHIRTFDLLVGFVAVLGMASVAAGESLAEQQIGHQIERRLSADAFSNVNVSVQASVVSLSGTVPSLWAKEAAIAKVLDLAVVTSVVSDIEVERAESDLAISEQIQKQFERVSIPGPRGFRAAANIDEAIYDRSSDSFYGIFDYVDSSIDDGVVTLTGYATDEYKAGNMVELVSRVQGVREIQNRIKVLPVSGFDDQLRASLARRIYGRVFTPHVRTAAPLHIVVDHLRVTLAGTVFSEVEKWQAEHIARLTFGVLSVQNNLGVELNDEEPRVTAVGTPVASSATQSTPSWSLPHE